MRGGRLDDPASILERALAKAPEEREAFLDEACRGSAELRRQVDRLRFNPNARTLSADASLPESPDDSQASTRLGDPYGLAGTRVAQYQIGSQLGQGGMGVVYEAHDTRLQRQVALKFLSLSLSDKEAARDRFFAEARAASALDHNNICTIHEISETETGRVFIVMARYQGETLKDKIASAALAPETALGYGVQITIGLIAAHEKGILHRDLKPANVMITEPAPSAVHGTAKILDFGLAKIEGLELTRTGTRMGTVGYMSPEQAKGERADQRADIWSLGVVLYEMLTGERPFKGNSELTVLQSVVTDDPVAPRRLNPAVPPELERVVLRCLEKDRTRRYPNAEELLSDLERILGSSASRSLSATPPRSANTSPLPRRASVGLAAALVVAALMISALMIPAIRHPLLRPFLGQDAAGPRLIAVLPFVNSLEQTAENDALTAGLTHSVTGLVARLGAAGNQLWIVPPGELVQQGVLTATDAQKSFGVGLVLTGSVQKVGSRTEIVVSLVDATSQPPRTLDSRAVAAPLSPPLRDLALTDLADLLELGAEAREALAFDDSEVTSRAAYALYLQGIGYLQRFDQAGNLDAAIASFQEAATEDPLYAPAHAGLCEALWEKHQLSGDPELIAQALVGCERAGELAANQAAVLVSIGRSYYEQGETRRARSELERAIELEPDRAEAYRWLGWVEDDEGRPKEAEAAFRQAIDLEPGLWIYYNDLGIALSSAGRHEEAAFQFERSIELTPENYVAFNALAVARKNLNQVADAERLYRRSIELRPNPLAYRNLGNLYFREQDYPRAIEVLERARDAHTDAPSFNDWILWSWLAHAYHWAGKSEAAEQAWRRLIEMAVPVHQTNPRDADALMLLCDAHVSLGEVERGRFFLSRLLALRIEANYTRFYIGRIYEMLGERELALDYLRQALEDGFDPLTVDRDPWLKDLRTEPSYFALRQQFSMSS